MDSLRVVGNRGVLRSPPAAVGVEAGAYTRGGPVSEPRLFDSTYARPILDGTCQHRPVVFRIVEPVDSQTLL